MSRFACVPILVPLAAAVLLLPGSATAGEIRTFEKHGFRIEAPSNAWQWLEPNSDQVSFNYVVGLGRRDGDQVALLWIRVAPTLGSSVDELTENTRQGLRSNLPTVEDIGVKTGSVSGIGGTLVEVKGKNNRDEPVLVRVFTIQSGDRFHQLHFTFIEGGERTLAREADALRRGYRLLQGAGPEEKPETAFLEGAGQAGAPPEEAGGSEDTEVGRDGDTLTFPSHNIKLSLPPGSPFEWTQVTDQESKAEQTLCRAEAKIEHPAEEGKEDEGPVVNTARITLNVRPQPPGWTANGVVKHPDNQKQIEENAFDKNTLQYTRTKAEEDVDIGNHKGASLVMVGGKDGKVFFFHLYVVGLLGRAYLWEIHVIGDRNADRDFEPHILAFMKSVQFQETVEGVRGPLGIMGVPPHTSSKKRGSDEGKELTLERSNYEATKPAQMYNLSYDSKQALDRLRFAWETRSEDGQLYLYFDLQTLLLSDLRKNKVTEEKLVEEREGQWKQVAESPQTIAKGKNPYYRASYGRGRGLGYEFKGYLGDTPFVERGYVVSYKRHLYWIRHQFGGRGAEEHFADVLKDLKKAVKFLKD